MYLYYFCCFRKFLSWRFRQPNSAIGGIASLSNLVLSPNSTATSNPIDSMTTSSDAGKSNLILRRQLAELKKNPVDGFSAGLVDDNNLLEWDIMIIGPPDTLYEGGFFKARLSFPQEYPLLPPKMKFISEMWHPNIYENGEVCISILHAPGEDQWGYEDASERWLPIHTVETILMSVISLLSQDPPSLDSPANVDAARQVRTDLTNYRKKVRRLVRKSAEEAFE